MLLTANEYISLPEIRDDALVLSMNFLSMRHKGMLEVLGREGLVSWRIMVDGTEVPLSGSLESFWIPTFRFSAGGLSGRLEYIAALGHRALCMALSMGNASSSAMEVDLHMLFDACRVMHTVNESKKIDLERRIGLSSWSSMPLFGFFDPYPAFSIALYGKEPEAWSFDDEGRSVFHDSIIVGAGEEKVVELFVGLGFEEVAAVTSCRECERWGVDHLRSELMGYIARVGVACEDDRLKRTINRNLLFCLFFSTGITLDTEELVSVTSRSPRYYVSAAYWDRDALLWAFPAICLADGAKARGLLMYAATRQAANVGTHSRYIDGTVLEPGFELDELVSPVIAIGEYIDRTCDVSILDEPDVRRLVAVILERLEAWHDADTGLYATFLQPTDDMTRFRFLTYDNVLVWKALTLLSSWDFAGKGTSFASMADDLKRAIDGQCVHEVDGLDQFVWAVDGRGGHEVYDEPPGSLVLLSALGFCNTDDRVYVNTLHRIMDPSYEYSFIGHRFAAIGCAHAPHPWVLSMANSIRALKDEAMVRRLCDAPLDDGIVCESIDEDTGVVTSGNAFATAAGYVVASLVSFLEEE